MTRCRTMRNGPGGRARDVHGIAEWQNSSGQFFFHPRRSVSGRLCLGAPDLPGVPVGHYPLWIPLILPTITTEFLTCFKKFRIDHDHRCHGDHPHGLLYRDSFTWHGLETTTAASLVYLTIAWTVIAVMGRSGKTGSSPARSERLRMIRLWMWMSLSGMPHLFSGGLYLTVQLAVFAIVGGLVLGILLGAAVVSGQPWLYYPVSAYVHFFKTFATAGHLLAVFSVGHHGPQSEWICSPSSRSLFMKPLIF